MRDILNLREPASLTICTLLDKPSRREVEVPVEWVGLKFLMNLLWGMVSITRNAIVI